MKHWRKHLLRMILALWALLAGVWVYRGFADGIPPPGARTAREALRDPDEVPRWKHRKGFEKDTFTFVRLRYSVAGYTGRQNPYRWAIDYPDADLNLSWRLHQMTSLKVDPDTRILDIMDPELFRYPFVYMVEPGDLHLSDKEVVQLRNHLMNGGFLMVDDFWGEAEWDGFESEMRRVFPDRKWRDLPRSHPLFHCVFDIPDTLNLQCPNVMLGTRSEYTGVTWERDDARDAHFRVWEDDRGRICVIACHNTDNGDGWEREGENEYYFRNFSEKKAYPLGINIIFWAMTH